MGTEAMANQVGAEKHSGTLLVVMCYLQLMIGWLIRKDGRVVEIAVIKGSARERPGEQGVTVERERGRSEKYKALSTKDETPTSKTLTHNIDF